MVQIDTLTIEFDAKVNIIFSNSGYYVVPTSHRWGTHARAAKNVTDTHRVMRNTEIERSPNRHQAMIRSNTAISIGTIETNLSDV